MLNDYIDEFLQYITEEKIYSHLTEKSYGEDLLQFNNFLSGKNVKRMEEVNHIMIRNFLSELMQGDYAKKSIVRKLAAIKSFFKFLNHRKIIETNPAELVSSPKLNKSLPTFLYLDEINTLIDFLNEKSFISMRNRAMIEVLFSTGIRVSELINLNVSQIDDKTGLVKVKGKGNKERIVVLGSKSILALHDYRNYRRDLLQNINKKTEVLFLNQKGERITDRGVRYILENLVKKVALSKKVSPHVIRHSFATYMINNGCDLRVVQEMLGHVNLSTTQIYTHIGKNKLKDVYEKYHPHAL